MTLLSARKRAEEFEGLVNGLATTARPREDLAELATVVTALREHAQVTPRPDFAAGLREQLMAEAATVLTSESKTLALPTRRRGTRERRLVAAATAVVFVGGTAGMAVASQSALPGDPLYPIKRTIERAQAGLNTDDAGKGRDLLAQADDRLAEVQGLLDEDAQSQQVPATVDDFSEQAQEGADLLAKSFETTRDPQSIESVRAFAASSLQTLQELAKTAPAGAQESLANAAWLLQDIDHSMISLCSTCAADLPPLQITDVLAMSSGLKEAIEAAASADNSRVQDNEGAAADKPSQTSGDPSPPAEPPTDAQDPPVPDVPDPPTTVKNTKKDVKETVDETVDPAEELLDGVIPGAGDLVGDTTEGVTGSLLGGG